MVSGMVMFVFSSTTIGVIRSRLLDRAACYSLIESINDLLCLLYISISTKQPLFKKEMRVFIREKRWLIPT